MKMRDKKGWNVKKRMEMWCPAINMEKRNENEHEKSMIGKRCECVQK